MRSSMIRGGLPLFFCRYRLRLLMTGLLLLCFAVSYSQAAVTEKIRAFSFDLPAQSLQGALEQYSVITGRNLLYDSSMLYEKRSSPLRGALSADEGLHRLLRGSGLQAKYTSQNAFTLVKVQALAENDKPAAGISIQKQHYYSRLQMALTRHLCRDNTLHNDAFRAVLQFWFSGDGAPNNIRLLDTTGSQTRDSLILMQARQIRLDVPPPEDVRQPLTVLVDADLSLACGKSTLGSEK